MVRKMFANQNRFAMLSMDDDDTEIAVPPPPPPVEDEPAEKREIKRKWNLDEGRPEDVREWKIESSRNHGRRGPFSRYAFRDEDYTKNRIPRTYAFRDDSPPPSESKKTVSPELTATPETKSLKENDFPKLSEYVRPTTPPFPPDNGWYPTLAERIRVAMERKETAAKTDEKKVFNMDTVIPMPTRVDGTLQLK